MTISIQSNEEFIIVIILYVCKFPSYSITTLEPADTLKTLLNDCIKYIIKDHLYIVGIGCCGKMRINSPTILCCMLKIGL